MKVPPPSTEFLRRTSRKEVPIKRTQRKTRPGCAEIDEHEKGEYFFGETGKEEGLWMI